MLRQISTPSLHSKYLKRRKKVITNYSNKKPKNKTIINIVTEKKKSQKNVPSRNIKSLIINKGNNDISSRNHSSKKKILENELVYDTLKIFENNLIEPSFNLDSDNNNYNNNYSVNHSPFKKRNSLKKQYISKFLRCISQDNISKKISDKDIEEAKNEYDNNLEYLSKLIDDINTKGFKKNAALMIKKQNTINTLSQNLIHLNSALYRSRKNLNLTNYLKEKSFNETISNKRKYESASKERKKKNKDIKHFKIDINQNTKKIKNLRRETILLNKKSIKLLYQTKQYETEIQKLNLLISKDSKNKEKLGSLKNIISKGIISNKYKINDKEKQSLNFMLDIHEFVNDKKYFSEE